MSRISHNHICFVIILLFTIFVNFCAAVRIDRYDGELVGTVRSQTFRRTAIFYLAPSLDAFLVSGFPVATPEIGSIWLASNRVFFRLIEDRYPPDQLQLTTVEAPGNGVVTYQILEDVVQKGVVLNTMAASGGIFAFDYTLTSGTMVMAFGNNQVSGTVDVIGTSRNSLIQERYVADFTGALVGFFEF